MGHGGGAERAPGAVSREVRQGWGGVGSGIMRPALSVAQRTCEVVKGKVDRNMELQGKEIQIEETIHQRSHVTAWHVRADCPSASWNTQVRGWAGQPWGWRGGDHGASLKLPLPYKACSNPPFNKEENPGK